MRPIARSLAPVALVLAFVLALVLPRVAGGQVPASDPLPDRWRSLRAMPAAGSPEMRALLDDLEAGRIDPLALVRQLSPHAELPAGATYHAACSRALGTGEALLTLGDAEPGDARSAMAGLAATTRSGAPDKQRQFELMVRASNAQTSSPGVQRVVDFYTAHGARVGTVTSSTPLSWPGEAEGRALHVRVYGRNPYARASHAECAGLPTGTTIELRVR